MEYLYNIGKSTNLFLRQWWW